MASEHPPKHMAAILRHYLLPVLANPLRVCTRLCIRVSVCVCMCQKLDLRPCAGGSRPFEKDLSVILPSLPPSSCTLCCCCMRWILKNCHLFCLVWWWGGPRLLSVLPFHYPRRHIWACSVSVANSLKVQHTNFLCVCVCFWGRVRKNTPHFDAVCVCFAC